MTGEIEKAERSYSQWILDYPGDYAAHGNFALDFIILGQYERAIEEARASIRFTPNSAAGYTLLVGSLLPLDRLEDVKTALEESQQRKVDGPSLRLGRYFLAFLQNDPRSMQEQLDWAMGKPGAEDMMLSTQSDTEAYFGRLTKAREFSQRAVDSATRADARETAAMWRANEALREAEFGNAAEARKKAGQALGLTDGRDVEILSALSYARAGDVADAQKLADKLDRESPLDTMIQSYWLPTIRGAVELSRGHGQKAIDLLQPTVNYELGQPSQFQCGTMFPAYVRGLAYLSDGRGQEAAVEFQKLLDHRGLLINFPLGALARLQHARAWATVGDKGAARKNYDDFFALWKGADADLPILKEAKTTYARLH